MERAMADTATRLPLEATSPFELRVNLAHRLTEAEVRAAIASGDIGFLHSFTTGATVDGPGIRVVAWTSGCMWRCRYCHNPDTWTMTNGIPVSVDRAADELRKYRRGLDLMDGGFTLSGGEPLMQHRFAVKLFTAAKDLGIHTALDTNGFYGAKLSDAELGQVDLVMLDMKTWSAERHVALTGMDNAPTLEFARRLAELRRPMWLRYVLVPGLTDDAGDVAHLARFAATLGNVERVDVLPFHQMGKYKWEKLQLPYTLPDTQPPDMQLVERTLDVFRGEGLSAF
jgi:pyruvate formate lyase activating enzyme